MDKFDGFSNKSYEDLLDEYAGERLTSKSNKEVAPKQAVSKATPPANNSNIYSGKATMPSEPVKQPAPKPQAPTRSPSQPAQRSSFFNSQASKPATQRTLGAQPPRPQSTPPVNKVDLRGIKSFDEEMSSKSRASYNNKPPVSSDTMEFKKTKTKPSRSNNVPVIDKPYAPPSGTQNGKSPIKKIGNKNINPKAEKKLNDIVKALKVNKVIFIGMAICLAISILISSLLISCVNDVLAIGRDSETPIEVVLPNDADTDTAVAALKDAGLIKNELFCNLFIKAMGYSDENYLPGVYYFTESMGVEKMIKRFKTSSVRGHLISITIPEGYTIDKIFERLEQNKVCTAAALYKTIDEVDFSKEYDFISPISNKEQRYHVLEGYFYPATYEFEQGADPATVVRTFLDAFKKHWTEEYAERAQELGMTTDEIIVLASIIEKEGANATQFSLVSSVLHNRLNRSGLYPLLELNSTKDYVTNTISARVSSKSELNSYIQNYNTYEKEGLPVGAICNPGADAIEAALYPDNTQYYFFAHDNKKKIYMAETMEQHDANRRQIAQVNAQK